MDAELAPSPGRVVHSEQRLRRAVVERAASQLAASFQIEHIAAELYGLLLEKRTSLNISIDELNDDFAGLFDSWSHQLDEKVETARHKLYEVLRTVHLPVMPTMADLRAHADDMFVSTPSMNDIVERGWQLLIEDVFNELLRRKVMVADARA